MWTGLPTPKPTEGSQVLQRVWTGANLGKDGEVCPGVFSPEAGDLGGSSVFRGLGEWGHFSAYARPRRTLGGLGERGTLHCSNVVSWTVTSSGAEWPGLNNDRPEHSGTWEGRFFPVSQATY